MERLLDDARPSKRVCIKTGKTFEITQKEIDFHRRMFVPLPQISPTLRMQILANSRNERRLYNRKCDYSGREIVTMYPPEYKGRVYHQDIWGSDVWDAAKYGRSYDTKKSFFDQFQELRLSVPAPALQNSETENCEYNNFISHAKDCYMSFIVYAGSENIMYSSNAVHSCKDCVDCYWLWQCELMYIAGYCERCFNCWFVKNLKDSRDCRFSYDLRNCHDCILCYGLRNKSYCIKNQQLTKSEYEKQKSQYEGLNREQIEKYQEELDHLSRGLPHIAVEQLNCEKSSGSYLTGCTNCTNAFNVFDMQDCVNVMSGNGAKDCYDSHGIGAPSAELLYYCVSSLNNDYNCKFCSRIYTCSDLEYCESCTGCKNCFGCEGLKNKEFYILNKEYTGADYYALLDTIKLKMLEAGEYGEFFPQKYSAFAYNNSGADKYYPVSREVAIKLGFRWDEEISRKHVYSAEDVAAGAVYPADKIPRDVGDEGDKITSAILICKRSGRGFRVIKQELEFYKKYGLPLPTLHPDERFNDLRLAMNSPVLYDDVCDKCGKAMQSTYAPERPEIVYCEKCYQKTVN